MNRNWKDIDLFVGGISERLIAGAAFGPTFACINGIQFYNFKFGDRFYFEHGYQSGSLSPGIYIFCLRVFIFIILLIFNYILAQLDNIRKYSSLSSLICKTHPEVSSMPENPFIKSSGYYKSCHSFPEINYLLWMDKKKSPKYKPKSVTKGYGNGRGGGHGGYYGPGDGYDGKGKSGYGGKDQNYHKKAQKKYKHHKKKYHEDPEVDERYYVNNNYDVGPLDEHDEAFDSAPPSLHKDITDHEYHHHQNDVAPPPLPPVPPSKIHPPINQLHSTSMVNNFNIPPINLPTINSKQTIIYH